MSGTSGSVAAADSPDGRLFALLTSGCVRVWALHLTRPLALTLSIDMLYKLSTDLQTLRLCQMRCGTSGHVHVWDVHLARPPAHTVTYLKLLPARWLLTRVLWMSTCPAVLLGTHGQAEVEITRMMHSAAADYRLHSHALACVAGGLDSPAAREVLYYGLHGWCLNGPCYSQNPWTVYQRPKLS